MTTLIKRANLMNKLIFDESIGQWRLRTKADDDWAKAVIKAAQGIL